MVSINRVYLLMALLIFNGWQPLRIMAEEGMFLPDTITSLPLAARGLKIKPSEIYNAEGISLKDGVVVVGMRGTGSFVSAQGLVLTNYHVAFDGIVSLSNTEKNYAEIGYTAKSLTEEMPIKDYTVMANQDLKNITKELLLATENMSLAERENVINTRIKAIEDSSNEVAGLVTKVYPTAGSYYQVTYLVLRDVRLVYAPPANIGGFGGDIDNFEWPRHTGDFTFLRAYVSPDGNPVDYAPSNIPYKPKKFLPISLAGVKEGDYAMILGYPGFTSRYLASYFVANTPSSLFRLGLLKAEIKGLQEVGKQDAILQVSNQAIVASLSNSLKIIEGTLHAINQGGLIEKKREQEARFQQWVALDAKRKAKYGNVLTSIAKAYDETPLSRIEATLALSERTPLLLLVGLGLEASQQKALPETERSAGKIELAKNFRAQIRQRLAKRQPIVESEILRYLLRVAAELPTKEKIAALEKRFNGLIGDARISAEKEFVQTLVENRRFNTVEAIDALYDMPLVKIKEIKDPLIEFVLDLNKEVQEADRLGRHFSMEVAKWQPLLEEGMREMYGKAFYPDANQTLRFTYGEIKGYIPRNGLSATPFTTLSGVMEKDKGIDPFNVSSKLKELYKTKDFGIYKQENAQDVVVNFLTSTDTTGGNSGSPVMNARGEIIGIFFDNNYEGTASSLFYNANKTRSIVVDVRYILFVVNKVAGVDWLLHEMKLISSRSQ